jgi:hypothetical protein
MKKVKFAGYSIRLPNHPLLRMGLGLLLVLGGFLGFLPILGVWMLPLGFLILSVDFAVIRRLRRGLSIRLGYFLHRKRPSWARRLGYGPLRRGKL